MDQLYCIYRSIEKSICSTISASFPSACIVSFLAFISYMVLRLFFSLHKNRSKNFSGVSGMVYQGVWTAIFTFYTYMVLFRTWIAPPRRRARAHHTDPPAGSASARECPAPLGRAIRQDIWRLGLIYRKRKPYHRGD